MTEKVKAIITGATGMVGEEVVESCISSPDVESILLVNRRESGFKHPKIKEIVHKDLSDLESIEDEFKGYNSVYYCMGTSSVGVDKDTYYKITYDMPMAMVNSFAKVNNAKSKSDNNLTFVYVTGNGTNINGWQNWQKVKGKTEADIIKSPIKNGYAFRPGFMKPTPGLRYTSSYYKYIGWMYGIGRAISSNGFITLKELGSAMINASTKGYSKNILEGSDIVKLANKL
ncbi:hypothetical protein DICPUDRAFT_30310 [Dictyostelium purpureum]|uniref:NAD-dependent epimerase/dehydratase domain-containing protein n=1 Tax=Dictyostelium purpureum TaxID=5786 RepID=F0ZF86_DICPU|nr:uncharacterized protein DICPUDRAFT_30310 [Dictyostelium purpureum]EGC37409.1 hypothetical protein DICPUDRAFT_30310 [Dictyostelium purpureum]|eukprot:XP_003286062.1 hypothetical protein DICPUDRAFT_30310 [Dictyostelium purpureum]